jgi:hypothetical protein
MAFGAAVTQSLVISERGVRVVEGRFERRPEEVA